MTRIIALSVPKVKPTRRTNRPAGRFGAGLLRSTPVHRVEYTVSDAQWWSAQNALAEDRHYDQLCGESAAMDRLEAGLCC